MSRPFIVCGFGQVGTRVADLLLRLGEPVTAITTECRPDHLRAMNERGAQVIVGDARDERLIDQAGIANAAAILALTDSDVTNLEIALDARRRQPDLPVVARIFDRQLAHSMERTFGVRRAVATSALAAPAIAAAALHEEIAGSLAIGNQAYVLRRMHGNSPGAPMQGSIPIGGADGDGPIAMLLEQSKWRAHRQPSRGSAGEIVRSQHDWARPWALMWSEAPVSLRQAFLILVALVALSVGVFKIGMGLSFVDAVYFTVTTVTTTGYGDITPREGGTFLKLYASLVMLFGSAMMAVVFSFIADFVIKERFRTLTRRRPVPDQGHTIVVGLGNVGYRTVNTLERWGVATAAVELQNKDGFTPDIEVRCPVVVGDGRLVGTLSKARVESAAAVVAVTGDDAVNLGIVLAARELNSGIRTVARLFDAEFAAKVRNGLAIDSTLSASQIAAPTLVAAALYPGVQIAFLRDNCLYAICETDAGPHWGGMRPSELRQDRVQILLRRPAQGEDFGLVTDDSPVDRFDQLVVVHHRRFATH